MARRPPGRRAKARTPEPKPEEKKPSGRRTAIIASMALLVIIAVSVVIGLYFSIWQDLWSPVLKVNDETTNMDYLIRRMKYFDRTDDILAMVYEVIPHEILVRQGLLVMASRLPKKKSMTCLGTLPGVRMRLSLRTSSRHGTGIY